MILLQVIGDGVCGTCEDEVSLTCHRPARSVECPTCCVSIDVRKLSWRCANCKSPLSMVWQEPWSDGEEEYPGYWTTASCAFCPAQEQATRDLARLQDEEAANEDNFECLL